MAGWNFADVWETVTDVLPDAEAQVQGDRRTTWAAFDRRADGLAQLLLDGGARHQDKVAQYLYNCPEYLESVFALFKAGLVPVNTNYRYTDDELAYLWDNADAIGVVFHGTFAPTIERIRPRVPTVRHWFWVDDGSGPCPEWATPYEEAVATPNPGRVQGPWGRSGTDLFFIYTGGTTGMPKGVMWEQDTLARILFDAGKLVAPPPADLAELRARLEANGAGMAALPAAPLMHGTGCLVSLSALNGGGRIVLTESRHLDAAELLDRIEQEKVNMLIIVGDVFARPILAELDRSPGTRDLSSLFAVASSGVMWSEPVKQGLLKHHPGMLLIDALGSSEAVGMGTNISAGDNAAATARFSLGDSAVVITDDGRLVQPGSGELGRVGIRGLTPVGYYKDPDKSAATFPVIDGVRYSLPGDWATVEADGTITLLGRGSVCINTGGEKVFPEEVEEVLKHHPAVLDAVAVGMPDERWGETVNAVVELRDGAAFDEGDLIDHVKGHLAHFKAPKRVFTITTIGRGPNGKVDYKRMRAYASDQVGTTA
ncbi:MAG: acyl-CoA synthetase [Acidimicrobiales bacterium]|nr:acyl-CoA synthetase [Acidimicrobiales bacterium]